MRNINMVIMLMASLATFSCSEAQIKNSKVGSFMVYGNCGMCEKRIEAAARVSGEAKGDWDRDAKMISLIFDSTKTNADVILKRIADIGHDNEKFVANQQVYDALPECCQYVRKAITSTPTADNASPAATPAQTEAGHPMTDEVKSDQAPIAAAQADDVKAQINGLLGIYYGLKDALVASNTKTAAAKAGEFELAIETVDMRLMAAKDHSFFMPIHEQLALGAKAIKTAKDLGLMRELFDDFSSNMLKLVKYFEANKNPVYYQYCPMKKMYWLSNEKAIRNPYYGDEMLECGSVKETIK